ncbi:unnamed protein product, partial [Musa hybrid cultivar]
SCITDLEDVAALDNDVVHVHRPELGEVRRYRDEVHGGALVELDQIRRAGVPLPPQHRQLLLEDVVGGDHLAGGDVDKDLAAAHGTLLAADVLDEADHAVLEHPHPRHYDQQPRAPQT